MTDVAIAVALAALSLLSAYGFRDSGAQYTTEPNWFATLLILAMTLPLAFRRRYPVTVLFLITAAFVVDRMIDFPPSQATFALAFALHAVGSDVEPRRRSALVGWSFVIVTTGFTALGAIVGQVPWITVFVMAGLVLASYLLGREVYTRRSYQLALERRAERLLADQERRARDAVRDERARIARELHDVVAHQMTVMTVQAAGARRIIDADLERAAGALTAIEQAGHDGLAEMRRLIHLLRDEDESTGTDPQPGLDRLQELAGQMTETGLPVELTVSGEPRPLPAGMDLNAFRIVQESLTNVMKHGGGHARATVDVEYGPDTLTLQITDDGRGAATALAGNNGAGQGIVGMRQRVDLFDGSLETGPVPGGGYRVRATIPMPPP